MQYTITLPDDHDYGTTFAREQRNAAMPQTVPGPPDAAGNPTAVPNPDLHASNAEYVGWLMAQANASWCTQAQAAGVTPPTAVPPPSVNSIPQQVTRRQGIQALINKTNAQGQTYYSLVQPAINAITDPATKATMQNEWDNSTMFERQRASLISLAGAIGINSAGLDSLFQYAATL